MRNSLFFGIVFLIVSHLQAQPSCFKEVVLLIDTLKFTQQKNTITFRGDKYLAFEYFVDNPPCEIRLYPQSMENIQKIALAPSGDFELIDSVFRTQDHFRF
ncbi:MAG: hypothetical protein ACK40K_08085, partial [Raineya sp.]